MNQILPMMRVVRPRRIIVAFGLLTHECHIKPPLTGLHLTDAELIPLTEIHFSNLGIKTGIVT